MIVVADIWDEVLFGWLFDVALGLRSKVVCPLLATSAREGLLRKPTPGAWGVAP